MVRKCSVAGCKDPAYFKCSCTKPEGLYCNIHNTRHGVSASEREHVISMIVEPLDNVKHSELIVIGKTIISKLSMIENESINLLASIFRCISDISEKNLFQISQEKQKILKLVAQLERNSIIDTEEKEELRRKDCSEELLFCRNLGSLKQIIGGIGIFDLEQILNCCKEGGDSFLNTTSGQDSCKKCRIGYYIKCEEHLLCDYCKICYCSNCLATTQTVFDRSFKEVLKMEEYPIRGYCDTEKNICTEIYKGYNETQKRQVAITKIISKSSDARKFNVHLMSFLGKHCSSFLWINGSFESKGSTYIVTEYAVDSLSEIIETRFTDEQMTQIITKLLQGFTFMSFNNIYQQNISLNSILFTRDLQPKIVDFSLAVQIEKNGKKLGRTNSKLVVENNPYSAPERKKAEEDFVRKGAAFEYNIEKADVFSLGIVLLQTITKFESKLLNGSYGFIAEKLNDVKNKKIKNLIVKMVKINPNERPYFKDLLFQFSSSY